MNDEPTGNDGQQGPGDLGERHARLLTFHALGLEVLRILGRSGGATDGIRSILLAIKAHLGFEAVGIRLRQGEDFPYYVVGGFSEEFLVSERSVCAKDCDGQPVQGLDGSTALECLCGVVLRGGGACGIQLTGGGSFWTNAAAASFPPSRQRPFLVRGRCLQVGYESIALIPLRSSSDVIGLLQLCDQRSGLLTEDLVQFLEELGSSVGITLERMNTVELLRRSQELLEEKVEERTRELSCVNTRLLEENATRLQAEEQARRAHRELEQIFNAAAGGMRIIDVNLNVVRANDTLAEISGFTREEMEGRKCYETLPGDSCGSSTCSLRRIRMGESSVEYETFKRVRSGRAVPCSILARPYYDSTGRFVGIIEDVHDITERRRLESVAQAVNVMDNIKYAFAGIRHELGNPINSIKMTLSVLKLKLHQFPADVVLEYVDRAMADASRVQDLLNSLRSFTMFEQLNLEEVDLSSFLGGLQILVAPDFEQQGIAIQVSPVDPSLKILADPRALRHVFLNLLTNAGDALAARPNPRIRIEATREGSVVRIIVRDNGCGMAPRLLQDLFKPFHTNKPKGTGLGLVIVKKMLIGMEATIDVSSREGEGTEALLTFPCMKTPRG